MKQLFVYEFSVTRSKCDDKKHFIMTAEWLSALNPFLERERNTVFNLIANPVDLGVDERKYAVELILAAVVANGMSKLG